MDILMQFLSSAVIAGLVTGAVNSGINDKRIRADIVSKSRIDWIQAVRKSSAEYITELHKLIVHGKNILKLKKSLGEYDVIVYETYMDVPTGYDEDGNIIEAEKISIQQPKYNTLSNHEKEKVDRLKESLDYSINKYNSQIDSVIEKTIHLRMFFSSLKLKDDYTEEYGIDENKDKKNKYEENSKHIEIKNKMSKIKNNLNATITSTKNQSEDYVKIYNEIIEFSEYLSDYLKEEWDRSKKVD